MTTNPDHGLQLEHINALANSEYLIHEESKLLMGQTRRIPVSYILPAQLSTSMCAFFQHYLLQVGIVTANLLRNFNLWHTHFDLSSNLT